MYHNNNNIIPTKQRRVISPARLTKPWQYIHQNVRLGREGCAISPHAEMRYRGDVIRKKRRQKTPFTFNGENQKISPHFGATLLWHTDT